MFDKTDKILSPLDWIWLIVGGILVVALLGWTFGSNIEEREARDAALSTEGCKAIGVAADEGARTRAENNLRTIYSCPEGRMVIK